MEYICYVLYTNNKQEAITLKNTRFCITIIKVNPNNILFPLLGRRYNIIYCDAELTKSITGQELIEEVIKPCCTLGNREFYLI